MTKTVNETIEVSNRQTSAFRRQVQRFAPWVITIWLLAITTTYLWTAYRSLKQPLNYGWEQQWAAVWIAFAVTVVLSHLLFRRKLTTVIWLAGLAGLGLAMIVLSRQVTSALTAGWLVLVAWCVGDWVLRRFRLTRSQSSLEWNCIAMTLGLALLALLALVLAYTHRLTTAWVWGTLITLAALQWRSLWSAVSSALRASRVHGLLRRQAVSEKGVLATLVGFVVLINLAWAVSPEIQYDALNYHLAVPKIYVAEQRLLDLPDSSFSYLAHMVDMLFALSMALHGEIVAKLLTFAMSLITLLSVYVLGHSVFGVRVGLWAAALFYSTPLISWLSATTYVDLAVGLFLLTALLALLRWHKSRCMGWLLVCGTLSGASLGVKLTAVFGLPVIGLTAAWDALRSRDVSVWTRVGGVAGSVVGGLLMALPWFAIVFVYTGNPFYPLFSGFASNSAEAVTGAIASVRGPHSQFFAARLLELPFTLTFRTNRFAEALAQGAMGIAIVMLPLSLLLLFRKRRVVGLLISVATVYIGLWALASQYARYFVPIVPLLTALAVAPAIRLSSPIWLRRLNIASLGTILMAQVVVIPLLYWQIPERIPVIVAAGLETRDDFLSRTLPPYAAARYLNGVISPGQRVLGVNVEHIRFYLNAPLMTPNDNTELQRMPRTLSDSAWIEFLTRRKFGYLLISRPVHLGQGSAPWHPDFLDQHATLEFTSRNVDVYRPKSENSPMVMRPNLASNPGFERLLSSGEPEEWQRAGNVFVAANSGDAHTGRVAVRSGKNGSFHERVQVEPNKPYSLGLWARADQPHQFGQLRIEWLDASLLPLAQSVDIFRGDPGWTWQEFGVMSPPRASYALIYASVWGNSAVWFDDFAFVQGQVEIRRTHSGEGAVSGVHKPTP